MTEGSLPGLIPRQSKIFKSYQIQMQNVNFTCITHLLKIITGDGSWVLPEVLM